MFLDSLVFKFLSSLEPYYFHYSPSFRKEVFPNLTSIIGTTLVEDI
jgi:hypothetical protein